MSESILGVDFIAGFLIAMLIAIGFTTYIRDQGRDECEQKLPRAEKCIQKWVPQHATAQESE
ncbi:hypothetical protein [Comamonas resistens]|uniref:hypothetical protein n=1 Tax=Comamonas resistens TaxID=3046670 RepID=UPI0039BC61C0